MVHLAKVQHHTESALSKGVDALKLSLPGQEQEEGDAPGMTVYGTRYACEELPSHEMPEREMPREVAYRMIKDELSLDGNPMLKYSSSLFCIGWVG